MGTVGTLGPILLLALAVALLVVLGVLIGRRRGLIESTILVAVTTAAILAPFLYLWGTRPGRYQLVQLNERAFVVLDTATAQHDVYARRGDRYEWVDYKEAVGLSKRLFPEDEGGWLITGAVAWLCLAAFPALYRRLVHDYAQR